MDSEMNTELESVKNVSERIRAVEDRLLEDADILARTKERLIFDPAAYRQRSGIRNVAAGALVAAAAAALFLILTLQPGALTVQANGKSLAAGAWISSSPKNSTTLTFSDGSAIELNAASGLRIRDLTPEGAHILLERGALDAGVKHREKTRWKLDVGPYLITVVGTKFHVSWDPDTETFGLKMIEGSVNVEGPMLAARRFQEGESLSASLTDGTVKINVGSKPDAVIAAKPPAPSETASADPSSTLKTFTETEVSVPAPLELSVPAPLEQTGVEKRKSREPSVGKEGEWRKLSDQGRFADAVRAAEKEGIRKILSEAPARDLIALGDAARHAGEFSLAADAYTSVRRRYTDSTYAAGAAFALGIMAFDGRRDYASAAQWFSKCMEDKRSGTLSREASGRLMESYRLLGDKKAAAEIAAEYLEKYPNGPHAALAGRLTQ